MNMSNDFLWTVSFRVGKSETCNVCVNPSFCVINDAFSTKLMYVFLSVLFWVSLTFFLANSCVNLGYENNWLVLRSLSILSEDLWSSTHGVEEVFLNVTLSGPGTDGNPDLSPEPVDTDPSSLVVSNSSDVIFSSFSSRFIISSHVISWSFICVKSSHFWSRSSMSISLCCRISSLNSLMFLSSSSSTSNTSIFPLIDVSVPNVFSHPRDCLRVVCSCVF